MFYGLLFIALTVVALRLVLQRRDSRFYHWLAALWQPFRKRRTVGLQVFSGDLPGAEIPKCWRPYQPTLMTSRIVKDVLQLEPSCESLWWRNQRGPMWSCHVSGDGDYSASVKISKASQPAVLPDCEWQFVGIILRDPASEGVLARENYVFEVIGHRYQSIQLECKSTVLGHSQVDALDWPRGEAELKISRRGAEFRLYAKPDSGQSWQCCARYWRPDLPATLQFGVIVYAFSEGRGRYDMRAEVKTVSSLALSTTRTNES